MRILQATAEFYPYSKTGGLADMVSGLSSALVKSGEEVTVVTPFYREVRERVSGITEHGPQFYIKLGENTFPGRWWEIESNSGVTVLFLENEGFFNRSGLYMKGADGYWDNPERFMFLSKAVIRLADEFDVVHVHDWQTAFVPMLMKIKESENSPKSVLTIHNLAFQGQCEGSRFDITNLPLKYFKQDGPEYWGGMNYLKAGLHYADQITTVSPQYAREILTPEFGEGMEGTLQFRQKDLRGILNGVDYEQWNTNENPHLPTHYSADDLTGKQQCKTILQMQLGLRAIKVPLYGTVSRLAHQKGIDVLVEALKVILCENDIQVVILGSGEKSLVQKIRSLQDEHPDSLRFIEGYDNSMAHRIEAGADFFVMPSRFEPCGLNQLYSLRYGTLPIVHGVGGLEDTVIDAAQTSGNGFKFYGLNPGNLINAIRRSINLYYEQADKLHLLRDTGMRQDFSWDRAISEYKTIF